MLNFSIEVNKSQKKRGKYFIFGQPQNARSWLAKSAKELESHERVFRLHFDLSQCASME